MRSLRFAARSFCLPLLLPLLAAAQPAGFQVSTVFSGFSQPVTARFAPDGRVFVLEKWGTIKAFDGLTDTTATLTADLSNQVWTFHDHGALGLAVDPQFPTRPYLYVLYALRGAPGGRLVRLTIDPATNKMTGSPLILIEDWAQVYPSHSIGNLMFGPEGALYVSAGDGASYDFADWGQSEPHNPDNSPLGGIDIPDPPNEGGALRSQDIRSTGDPLGFDGTVLRVNPDTGEAWPGNPLAGGTPADDRIIAYGLRNPYRFTIHPTNNSVWVCDVGWNDWEEINRIPYPFASPVPNFGWPAYEGVNQQPAYKAANLPLLQSLYSAGTATPPFYTYQHVGSSSASAIAFYPSGNYPAQYRGALFFGDYAAGWIKVMFPDANGNPNPGNIQTFLASGTNVVDLQSGPGGDIYYVDFGNQAVKRIRYLQGNNPPVAVIQASSTSGSAPLTVNFTGSGSFDPDPGNTLGYSWDLNGDNVFGDATTADVSYTFTQAGNYTVRLRVMDNQGASDTKSVTISVNNLPPVPVIDFPVDGTTWRVGDVIEFGGHATDPETGPMPASRLSWVAVIHHCSDLGYTDCHEHPVLDQSGVASGAFYAIDHEFPCYIELRLTATEPGANGLSVTTSLYLYPELTTLTLKTNPPGLSVGAFAQSNPAPWVKDVIINGDTAITAPSPQTIGNQSYIFASWSDGGAQSHNVHFGATPITLTANFTLVQGGLNRPPVIATIWDQNVSQGSAIGFYINASDPDGNVLSMTSVNLPFGATLSDQGNGKAYFEWFTRNGDAGDHTITVTATDNGVPPMSTSADFTVHVLSTNRPPGIDAVWNTQVTAGAFINLRIGAWDTDGDIPDLFAENLPPGANYVTDGWGTGFLTWQTGSGDVGVYTGIRVYAVDHGVPQMTSERVFMITVVGSSNAPVIDPIPASTVVAGNTLILPVSSRDPNGTIPVLTAQNLPQGATFVSAGNGTGVFTWPTKASDAGNHSGITILATDSATPALKYKAVFPVNVIRVGSAPVINPIGPKTVQEGAPLQFTVTATDPDSGPPTLSVIGLPIGATFINNGNGSGTFNWTPAAGASASSPYSITFMASDGANSATEIVQITVQSANRAPQIAAIGNKTVAEGQQLQFVVTATDPDGTVPTLSGQSIPSGANFVLNGNGSGTFTWTPDYTAAAASPYTVTFVASDGALTDSKSTTITVTDTNRPPTVAAVGNKTVAEGQLLQFNVSATDPDGTVPTLTAQSLPSGATFVNNGNGTGTFAWTPNYDAAANSPYTVTFVAGDGLLTDSKSSSITVTNTNRAPVLGTVGNKSVAEGQLLQFNVSASDPDGTIPTLTAQGVPSGASFVNNGNGSGTFTWTPSAGASANSPYTVTFTAADGALTDSKSSVITVTAANRAPILAAIGNKTVAEGQLLSFIVSATDPDGTVPSISAQGVPSGAQFTNHGNGSGTFTWTPDYDAAASSPYTVTFVASDGSLTDSKSSTITVTNVNRAPVLSAIGNKSAVEGSLLTFTVTASDPDGTVPSLTAQGLPAGATFVNSGNGAGTFSWTPPVGASAGSPFTVTFIASDGSLTDSKSSTISVMASSSNRPPVFSTIWAREVTAGAGIGFYITATDPDGGVPVYTSPNLPIGARLILFPASPSIYFEWFPTAAQVGDYNITIVATDAGSPPMSGSATFLVRVLAGNIAPKMDTVYDQTVAAGTYINLRIGAWDTDGDEPSLSAFNLPPRSSYTSDGHGTGFFTWQTSASDVGVYSNITIVATDHGNPPLSSQRVFKITVR